MKCQKTTRTQAAEKFWSRQRRQRRHLQTCRHGSYENIQSAESDRSEFKLSPTSKKLVRFTIQTKYDVFKKGISFSEQSVVEIGSFTDSLDAASSLTHSGPPCGVISVRSAFSKSERQFSASPYRTLSSAQPQNAGSGNLRGHGDLGCDKERQRRRRNLRHCLSDRVSQGVNFINAL